MDKKLFNQYLAKQDFSGMFIGEMGWNKPQGQSQLPVYTIDGKDYYIDVIAQRNGFQILTCEINVIPSHSVCRKLDSKVRYQANDYILIFSIPNSEHQCWSCPVKQGEKREVVLIEYDGIAKAGFLFSKIDALSFDFGDITTIIDVRERVQHAFSINSEKITKDFYAGFRKEHEAFAKFIFGITEEKDKQWYTSVMLNRLMFCYFIQKKGFLNGDTEYLSNKLKEVRAKEGKDKFYHSFYRDFLLSLFHDGLNSPRHDRDWERRFGRIPYLNGGMFEIHQLEQKYVDLDIADEAFIRLFTFFDTWQWHLDTRITASGKDINPDVLGYIFEQYINDRAAMGAYYTKEDITEYIAKNCILPFLFDAVAKTSSRDDFKPTGYVWQTLKNSGDRYIYDAVKKGYITDWRNKIPANIAKGLDTASPDLLVRRSDWNTPTSESFALPTEIWRETIERLQRCESLLQKIGAGKITQINDFITYNLNIRLFAEDLLLSEKADHRFVANFYHALQKITILDPTCGSGAFLFAAMNVLEPLYEICINRMEEFHEKNQNLFKSELEEIACKYRSNIQYFIYKSIILRNLYGVDIMVEATEIAKLRLFLKMVAVVEVDKGADNMGLDPLPDIDFNIRCGNTLVGYANKSEIESAFAYGSMFAAKEFQAKIDSEMELVATAYRTFKQLQMVQDDDMSEFKEAKAGLKARLSTLNDILNRHLHRSVTEASYEEWLYSGQPFHWVAEFYDIIVGNGGFDVIIGNPPYLEKRQINYSIDSYKSKDSNAVHAYCIERSLNLLNKNGCISMIVPLSIVCTQRMTIIQHLLEQDRSVWYSNYAWRPSKLFDAVNRALSIFVAVHSLSSNDKYSTAYLKWNSECRIYLLKNIKFTQYNEDRKSFWMPKLSGHVDQSILKKVLSTNESVGLYESHNSQFKVYYRTTGGLYWKVFTDFSPIFYCNGIKGKSSRETSISVNTKDESISIIGLLSSSLFWWWYTVTSNLRDLNPSDIIGFRFPKALINDDNLLQLSDLYLSDLRKNSSMLPRKQKNKGETETQSFKISLSKSIIDKIDMVLSQYYGFTEEELDFIINYDIKYRMGDELVDDQ